MPVRIQHRVQFMHSILRLSGLLATGDVGRAGVPLGTPIGRHLQGELKLVLENVRARLGKAAGLARGTKAQV